MLEVINSIPSYALAILWTFSSVVVVLYLMKEIYRTFFGSNAE